VIIGSVSGVAETQAAITGRGIEIVGRVRDAITQLLLKLSSRVKEQKLSGQVLNVRTGRLRRSITYSVDEQNGQIIGTVGTNVEYARRLEMGFHGDEQIREHMRMTKMAFGKMMKNPHAVMVRAHSRKVNIAPHSFLLSSLEEMRPQIIADISSAVEVACGARS
jgi:phage gpG-like protein